jgi:hypothetical protein
MRKIIIALTLAASYFAVAAQLGAEDPPACSPVCTVR